MAGSWFHCLQATSQALQPIQRLVSVKKPIDGCVGNGGRFCKGETTLISCCLTVLPSCFCICRSSLIIVLYSFNASRSYITGESLCLFNTYIWLQHHMGKIISNAASAFALEAP